MFEFSFWALVLVLVISGASARATIPLVTGDDAAADRDFASFSEALAATHARLDALDASLGAVAALLFAIVTYLPEHLAAKGPLNVYPERGAEIALVIGILTALYAAVVFRGDDGPNLDVLLIEMRRDRATALANAVRDLARDHFRNSTLIARKVTVFWLAVALGTLGALVLSLSRVVH